jgi:hypothetical protein
MMRTLLTKLVLVLAVSGLPSAASIDVLTQDVLSVPTSIEGVSEPDVPVTAKRKASSSKRKSQKDEAQTPRQVKMLLSKGKEYYGFVVGKDMHGRGTLQYADGTVYEGDFVHNKRHGRGRIRYASGEQYQGEWFRGFMTGHGTYHFQDGSVYEVSVTMMRYLAQHNTSQHSTSQHNTIQNWHFFIHIQYYMHTIYLICLFLSMCRVTLWTKSVMEKVKSRTRMERYTSEIL